MLNIINQKTIKKILNHLFTIILIIIVLFVMEPFVTDKLDVDSSAQGINFIIDTEKYSNETEYIAFLEESLKQDNISYFDIAETYLILGRLQKNKFIICQSIEYYLKVPTGNPELLALSYETIASLDCQSKSIKYYKDAAEIWNNQGNKLRAELDLALSKKQPPSFIYNISQTEKALTEINHSMIAIKIENKWYVSDENGIFRFEVPEEKINNIKNRFLKQGIAIII